ncbi:MAG: redoxin domain-containing protein, partial [Acidobacteriota bacterium]|nr:redoxin domain-containing protein [Acidobacteriota bacterium]
MELQRQLPAIRAEGLGLAAISYDSRETLAAFSAKHGIAFPLLSDPGSRTIRRWGILNAQAEGPAAGIPHPGTFVINARGRVVSRAFEPEYQVRQTAASQLAAARTAAQSPPVLKPAMRPATREGRQLSVTTSQTDVTAAPGTKVSLLVDVFPKPKMHVYAPEQTGGYIRVELVLDDDAGVTEAKPVFPAASDYYFDPLKETFKVFDAPFRIRQDVTIALTPALRARAAARETLTLTGTLRYQACDDQVCYRPDQVAVSWS